YRLFKAHEIFGTFFLAFLLEGATQSLALYASTNFLHVAFRSICLFKDSLSGPAIGWRLRSPFPHHVAAHQDIFWSTVHLFSGSDDDLFLYIFGSSQRGIAVHESDAARIGTDVD